MSVFTPVTPEQLAVWLRRYDLGALTALQGISEGVQNSNFFVDTDGERHVLTLFENVNPALLPFYLDLMAHLARHDIPCPAPRRARDGTLLGSLNGKPAALFSRLSGASVLHPSAEQCTAVGRLLARLHLAGKDFPAPPHPCGGDWMEKTAARVMPLLPTDDAELLRDRLARNDADASGLPGGVIHADLFRDNVLFVGERIGGLLDFYFAGHGAFLFDLAIVANDWCCADDAALDPARLRALVNGYAAERPPTPAERAAWPRQLRAAALRFWLSRLADYHCPQVGEDVTVRDPAVYRRILERRLAAEDVLTAPADFL